MEFEELVEVLNIGDRIRVLCDDGVVVPRKSLKRIRANPLPIFLDYPLIIPRLPQSGKKTLLKAEPSFNTLAGCSLWGENASAHIGASERYTLQEQRQLICSWYFWPGKSKSRCVLDHATNSLELWASESRTSAKGAATAGRYDLRSNFPLAIATDRSGSTITMTHSSEVCDASKFEFHSCPWHRQNDIPRLRNMNSLIAPSSDRKRSVA